MFVEGHTRSEVGQFSTADMGQFYSVANNVNGQGCKKDLNVAILWLQKAVDQGDSRAKARLGRIYKEGHGIDKDLQNALQLISESAEEDSWGQYNLGLLYRDGEGVEQNDQKAVEFFEMARANKEGSAIYCLGWMYEQGRGVEKDIKKAESFYEAGRKLHPEDALYSIGRMYEAGLGKTSQNLQKAKEWYQKAAELGNESAKKALERF